MKPLMDMVAPMKLATTCGITSGASGPVVDGRAWIYRTPALLRELGVAQTPAPGVR